MASPLNHCQERWQPHRAACPKCPALYCCTRVFWFKDQRSDILAFTAVATLRTCSISPDRWGFVPSVLGLTWPDLNRGRKGLSQVGNFLFKTPPRKYHNILVASFPFPPF